jgi:hyperosmotically inducible periplasmic protein
MTLGIVIAAVMLSLGLLAAPGFTAQGPAGDPVATAERPMKAGDATATGEGTDSRLTLKTRLALMGDDRVSSNNVSVTTAKGVITLRGQVASGAERQAAEAVARTIEGPQAVVNHLTVVPQAVRTAVERRDDQLVTDVRQAIAKEASLQKTTIEVRAEKGVVTLTGKAPSLETSVRASEVVRWVSGVRAVRNELAW